MNHYDYICATCPTKWFIEPGTLDARPLHADGAHIDEQHQAVPLALRSTAAQLKMLSTALSIVREAAPTAAVLHLTTSDADRYGFVLSGLDDAAGTDILPAWEDTEHPLARLSELIIDEINDLEWDGVVGEDRSGHAAIPLGVRTETKETAVAAISNVRSYTEASHTAYADVAGVADMDIDAGGRTFRPGRITVRYDWRTQLGHDRWHAGNVSISGPWIGEDGEPTGTGSGSVIVSSLGAPPWAQQFISDNMPTSALVDGANQ